MKMQYIFVIAGYLVLSLLSCDEQSSTGKTDCNSKLDSPVLVEHELLTGTCLDDYIISNDQFIIRSDVELDSVLDQIECTELPVIDFTKKDLIGIGTTYTGNRGYNVDISVFKEDSLIEVLHCVNLTMNNNEPVSDVEIYLVNWILVDELNSSDSIIFTFEDNYIVDNK